MQVANWAVAGGRRHGGKHGCQPMISMEGQTPPGSHHLPANRSRTENWKSSLEQIAMRGGCLELAIRRAGETRGTSSGPAADDQPPDLLWRVRLLKVGDELVVERPAAAGKALVFAEGTLLTVSMNIGQNRWLFATSIARTDERTMWLSPPTSVERCSRREFTRASTTSLRLPVVQCWPLRDPMTTAGLEAALRTVQHGGAGVWPAAIPTNPPIFAAPELGPGFVAQLLNISGGGVGLLVSGAFSALLDSAPYLWMQVDLRPELHAPLAVTARRAHQHMDASGNINVGLAFEFACHPEHQVFVNQTLASYVATLLESGRASRAA